MVKILVSSNNSSKDEYRVQYIEGGNIKNNERASEKKRGMMSWKIDKILCNLRHENRSTTITAPLPAAEPLANP